MFIYFHVISKMLIDCLDVFKNSIEFVYISQNMLFSVEDIHGHFAKIAGDPLYRPEVCVFDRKFHELSREGDISDVSLGVEVGVKVGVAVGLDVDVFRKQRWWWVFSSTFDFLSLPRRVKQAALRTAARLGGSAAPGPRCAGCAKAGGIFCMDTSLAP